MYVMPRHPHSSFPRRVALGAALGVAAGTLLVGVGLLRAALFLLGGGRIAAPEAAELRMLAFYVGGFGAGGALIGALRPLLRGTAGAYVGCMLAGVVVMLAIVLGDKGSLEAADPFELMLFSALGATFGAAAAHGFTRSGP